MAKKTTPVKAMTTSSNYLTRAMKSRDPRFLRILNRLGYKSSDGKEMVKDVQVAQPPTNVMPTPPDPTEAAAEMEAAAAEAAEKGIIIPDEGPSVEEAGPVDGSDPLEEVANEKPADEEKSSRASTSSTKKKSASKTESQYSTRAMKAKE